MNTDTTNKILLEDVNFEGVKVRVLISKFVTGKSYKIHTQEYDEEMGGYIPYCIHTANFPDILEEGEVAVKEYNESLGSLAFLYAHDIIGPPQFVINSGHVQLPVCKLLVTP